MARTYAVPVTRISVDYGTIYVEADSAEDAGALRMLDGYQIDAGWRPNLAETGEPFASDYEFFRNYTLPIREA
jgi:hypothetical protein